MKQILSFFLVLFFLLSSETIAQTGVPLYKGNIPNSKPYPDEEVVTYDKDSNLIIRNISRPTLTIYLPPKKKRSGAAVVICPGGGYWVTASKHEGTDVAKRFNEMGVAAFVLKYRIPDDRWMINREIGPLQDAQRAIQMVREGAKQWGIHANRIGIMGFSAGGHLASTAGTHFQKDYIDNPKHTSLRPDFMILVYSVTSFQDSIGHSGSGEQLLGKNPTAEKKREYSNELQVTKNTPPAYLVHAKDDPVKVENSLVFAEALKRNGVPVAMHIYEKGGHGYGMYNKSSPVRWMDKVGEWMKELKFIPSK